MDHKMLLANYIADYVDDTPGVYPIACSDLAKYLVDRGFGKLESKDDLERLIEKYLDENQDYTI